VLLNFCKTLKVRGIGPGIVKKMVANGIGVDEVLNGKGDFVKGCTKDCEKIREAFYQAGTVDLAVASNAFGKGFSRLKLQKVVDKFGADAFLSIPTISSKKALRVRYGRKKSMLLGLYQARLRIWRLRADS
ncbi:hypothetical protein CEUSTIGMA_g10761.t1, partial [Chlamydomonas eustigma]